MSYIFFSFLAACLFAVSILLSKFLAKHKIASTQSLFALTLLIQAPLLLLIPIIGKPYLTVPAVPYLLGYSILFTLGFYFYTRGLYTVDASIIGPLFQLQSGFIVILAAIFLGEKFPPLNYLLLSIMILGAMLVSTNERMSLKGFVGPGVISIITMQLLHAISNIFVGFAIKSIDFWGVIFYGGLLNTLIVTLFVFYKKPQLSYSKVIYKLTFARSACQFFGAIFLFKAFQTNLSISSTIGLLSAPIVFIVSAAISGMYPQLLEHHSRKVYTVRGIGLLIILVSAVTLSLNK